MRNKTIIIPLLLLIALLSCENKTEEKDDDENSFQALKNDTEWCSTYRWANYFKSDKRMVIAGSRRDSEYFQDEQLHLSFKTAAISKSNTVTDFYSEWIFVVGGDAIADTYMIDSSYHNVIQIEVLDTLTKEISGTFEVQLKRDPRRSDIGETMLYKEGVFKLKYDEVE